MKHYIVKISESLLFLLLSTSCQSLLYGFKGIREPKIETHQSIYNYLRKINVDTSNVYALSDSLFKSLRSKPFKYGWKPGFRPIQLRIYDNSGKPIVHWASCEGFLNQTGTFKSVPPKNLVDLDSTLALNADLKRYYTIDGEKSDIIIDTNDDYYVVVYFAKYFPRMSKHTFREIERYQSKHPELKIKIYKVDVDILNWWPVEVETKLQIHH